MKIFDCFTFFNELELLELRFMELYNHIDYFIISEANKTHTGKKKPFLFEENQTYFKQYSDKIIYIKVDDLPDYSEDRAKKYPDGVDWLPENYQRNMIMKGLLNNASNGDKIILSDLDEIPSVEAIEFTKNIKDWVVLQQELYYYYVNCKQNESWLGTIIANYGTFNNLQQLRNFARFTPRNILTNAGWHYSYMGGAEKIQTKVQNIAESSKIINKIGNIDEIKNKMTKQIDLWDRKEFYAQKQIIDITNYKPKKLDEFLKKYPHFFFKG